VEQIGKRYRSFKEGMRDFRKRSLLSFVSLSDLSGIKETHNSTTCAKWGVESLRAPPGRIFHRSPVLTAG